ncbi:prothymosin alpha-like [Artibeus jamaicensis]|uniref:prothymosin alpha-like n=1 Tax=Artibeus jamaicensis TaxID=9417 RepID=UPI00235ABB7D|nr:prothymosin alpha-like [Artibeus jamaicensis]
MYLEQQPALPLLLTPEASSPESLNSLAFFLICCTESLVCPTTSDAAMDISSEITTKDLTEKEGLEEAENGRDALANRNANEENGEQEDDNMVDEEEKGRGEEEEGEEEEGVGEEEDEDEVAKAAKGKRAAKDDENDDADTKKRKTDEDEHINPKAVALEQSPVCPPAGNTGSPPPDPTAA